MRLIGTQTKQPNDCFPLSEIVTKSYFQSVTYTNIVNGFSVCALWARKGCGVDPSFISEADLTNQEEG